MIYALLRISDRKATRAALTDADPRPPGRADRPGPDEGRPADARAGAPLLAADDPDLQAAASTS